MSMKVDYNTIHTAADDCKKTGGELESLFGQLKSDLAPLVGTWTGDAQTAYLAAQAEWDKKFEELKQLLAQVAGVLPSLADGYQETERGVTGLF